ncbi:hypothetical protein B9Z55_021431 [Caenorhabditis nigoni]|nr:hypothetical protein B9Z55_021431 [Caenorhabditis nigoni]
MLVTFDEKIIFELECTSARTVERIIYQRNGQFTLITYGQNELVVPGHFSDAFLEDLETVLMKQKTVLNVFQIFSQGSGIAAAKCFSGLDEILTARTLAVKQVQFFKTNVSQGMSMIRYLNADELRHLVFVLPAQPVDFKDFLNGFRNLEEGYRFLLEISVEGIDRDDVIAIREFSSYSETVTNLRIDYIILENRDEFRAILGDKFELQKGIRWSESFRNSMKTPAKEEQPTITDVCEITARSVLENPLLMELILERFECFEIQKLRKVNRGVRKCIDVLKPDPHIEEYSIAFRFLYSICNQIEAHIHLKSGKFKEIKYWKQENPFCQPEENELYYYQNFPDGLNFEEICLTDFESTLRHQESCMEVLSIVYSSEFKKVSYEELSRRIGEVLKRREHPLKVRKLSVGSSSQMEVMEILSAIDKNSLKIIELIPAFHQGYPGNEDIEELPFEVDQLSQTDQWKNAKVLICKNFDIITPIEAMNILHFGNVEILVKTISSQDVFYLQINLLKSSNFQKFKISFRKSTIDESLHELIGEPYRTISDVKKVWYFRIPNTNYFIHIVLDTRDVKDEQGRLKPKLIIFTRVAKEDTPFF